ALDRERALIRIAGQLQVKRGNRIRQDQWFANFEILYDERPSVEQLHSSLQHHFDKPRRGKHDKVLDFMILQKGHVPSIEPGDPCWHRAGQTSVKQTATARSQTAIAPIAGL